MAISGLPLHGLNVANYFKSSQRPACPKFELETNLQLANQFPATFVRHALRNGRTTNVAAHLIVMNMVRGKPIEIATF
jgi:hypothetical protein